MSDDPFGRQPEPVIVVIHGAREDILYWYDQLKRRAEFKGDVTQAENTGMFSAIAFKIYPRAVND